MADLPSPTSPEQESQVCTRDGAWGFTSARQVLYQLRYFLSLG